jgi:telomere length regulation protein
MTDTPTRALKALRESLRTPIADVESLVECLEACLDDIGLASSTSAELDLHQIRRAIQRYLPSIQICLVSEVYPTFYHALDRDQLRLVERFFVENQSSDSRKLKISRSIALTSYLTIPSFLNASHTPPLPGPSRSFVLDILSRLRESYNIDELYWAVWASDSGSVEQGAGQGRTKSKTGPSELIWEEVVRGLAGVPAKCANAVGRWKTEGWTGDLLAGLEAKSAVSDTDKWDSADEVDRSLIIWS